MMTSVGGSRTRGNWEQTQGQTQSQSQHKQRPQVSSQALGCIEWGTWFDFLSTQNIYGFYDSYNFVTGASKQCISWIKWHWMLKCVKNKTKSVMTLISKVMALHVFELFAVLLAMRTSTISVEMGISGIHPSVWDFHCSLSLVLLN